jgi:hypothetical protein
MLLKQDCKMYESDGNHAPQESGQSKKIWSFVLSTSILDHGCVTGVS